jgi:hypothetical protein
MLSPTNWGNLVYTLEFPSAGSYFDGRANVNPAVISTNDCPPLVLEHTVTNGQVQLRWPTAATGFVLQQNTNLATTNWVPAPGAPSTNGTNSVISFPLTNPQSYFRLREP